MAEDKEVVVVTEGVEGVVDEKAALESFKEKVAEATGTAVPPEIMQGIMGMFQPLIDGADKRSVAKDDKVNKQLEGIGKLLMMCFKEIDALRKNQYVQQQILEAIFKATVTDPAIEAARIDKLAGKKGNK